MDSQAAALAFYIGHIALLFAASIAMGMIAGPIVTKILEFIAGKTRSTLDDRIIKAVKVPVESFFFLLVFFILLNYFPELSDAAALLERYTAAILIVLFTFLASEASGAVMRWYYEEGSKVSRIKFDLSLLPLARKITKLAIYTGGFILALSQTGFDVTGLIAISSVAGIIIGLASQETLANLFAGLALQIDRPYQYGEYLRLPTGEVVVMKKIGMRSTKLEDMSSNEIIVSNSELAKMRVVNYHKPSEAGSYSIVAELPYDTDFAKLKEAVEKRLIKEKPEGLLPEQGFSYTVSSLKCSQTIKTAAFTFYFWAKGYRNSLAISQMANLEIISFVKKGQAA